MKGLFFVAVLLFQISFIFTQIQDKFGPCDPLVPENCLLPFPNNFWTFSNSSTSTGLNLRFTDTTFPADRRGEGIEPGQWNELDGFSPTPAIMSYFADLSLDNVPPHKNIALSLREDCPTILLDTETLEKLPHWGELDQTTPNTTDRAFMMWPIQRLVSGRRYIVAMRNLISTSTGLPIPASEAFASLLSGTSTDPAVYLRQEHFDNNIFPLLTKVGVDLSTLQLAWDFTVGSTTSITGRLISMRDDGLSRLPSTGPVYYITEVNENPYENVARQIKGELEIPLYTNKKGPGSHLVIEDGVPVFQGWANTTFTVNIPNSLVTSGTTGMILQYGHGLFGSQDEVNNGNLRDIADQYGYVTAATDWWGMCAFDVPAVTLMMSENLTDFSIIPDRTQQGILNFIILSRMLISGSFASDPNLLFNGNPVIDTSRIGYNGNSQGGIYGATFMTVSQDILQGVLGVPGGPYALMLPRSVDFDPYFAILKTRYPNPFDRINLLNIFQLLWDRSDPSGYMSYTTSNTLPNTPAKQIILQYSLGDSQVTWLSALEMGRSMGAYMFPNNVQEDGEILYGFPIAEEPVDTAVIQGFNYGAPAVPQTNTPPPEEYDTHSCCRKDTRAIESMNTLFTTGKIVDYCNGACNPPNPPIDDSRCVPTYNTYNLIPQMMADYLQSKYQQRDE